MGTESVFRREGVMNFPALPSFATIPPAPTGCPRAFLILFLTWMPVKKLKDALHTTSRTDSWAGGDRVIYRGNLHGAQHLTPPSRLPWVKWCPSPNRSHICTVTFSIQIEALMKTPYGCIKPESIKICSLETSHSTPNAPELQWGGAGGARGGQDRAEVLQKSHFLARDTGHL